MNRIGKLIVGLVILGVVSLSLASDSDSIQVFRDHCARLARAAEQQGTISVRGRVKTDWLFLGAELRYLSSGPFWNEGSSKAVLAAAAPSPLAAILDFNQQLQKIGVALLLVPVPAKAAIYPEFLPDNPADFNGIASNDKHWDSTGQAFYSLLISQGVRLLDLTPLFLNNRSHPDGAMYCRQDSHWSGNACVLTARALAHEIRALPGYDNKAALALTSQWQTLEITGDLWQALLGDKPAKESLRLRLVGEPAEGTIKPLKSDSAAAVILLGDSHNLIFHAGDDMHYRGAGLVDQLALELGAPLDLVATRGSGATPARVNLLRRAQRNPTYWKNKKVLIWCFAAREFTESQDWRKVPIAPP